TLVKQALQLLDCTGHSEVALTSLSTSDYSSLGEFANKLTEETEKRKVNLSLPSLRVDSFSLDLMEKTQKVRKSGLTFAPEAGTQRLRDIINKNITEEDILNAVKIANAGGYTTIKLYFMLGLPGETMEDVEGIAHLINKITDVYRQSENKKLYNRLSITASTSFFVPKPFTPFQWVPQLSKEEYLNRQQHLDKLLRDNRKVRYNWHEGDLSTLEAVMARGDRRVGKVIYTAWENGCKFDSWDEHFKYDNWTEAFKTCGIDPLFYSMREREKGEVLPWDHIDIGVSRDFLWSEYECAKKGETTPDCRTFCSGCGATTFGGGVCYE
ncbi:MAG TPA: TIGR03960 family B12-binding radical SAM protein, partial [Clostridiales bacterium]|nr:TIGR03960 family B12-binding radical SAM protein [Clostridiales bacterium]